MSWPSPPLEHSHSGNGLPASSGNDSFTNFPENNEDQMSFLLVVRPTTVLKATPLAEAQVATPRAAVSAAPLPPQGLLSKAAAAASAHPHHGDHGHETPSRMVVSNDSCLIFPAACLQQVTLCQVNYWG